MKRFKNKSGNEFTFDEHEISYIKGKGGERIEFTNLETLALIRELRLWDEFHRPFNILSMKKWVEYIKMARFTGGSASMKKVDHLCLDSNGNLLCDYEIAKKMREYIDSNPEILKMEDVNDVDVKDAVKQLSVCLI